jgi:aldose 1-epimerase
MFIIETITENGFEKVVLRDGNGTFASVIPACGAILHDFSVNLDGKPFNIIDSYDSLEDFQKNVTSKGFKGSKLSPFVCRLYRGKYKFEGRDHTIEKYYDHDNALHGLLYDQPFRITGRKATENSATVTMVHEYRAMDHGYPFNYDCRVTWELEKDNWLTVTTEVINMDEVVIPLQDGWHPYFKLDADVDDLELQFKSYELVEFDKDLIPTGHLIPYKKYEKLQKIGSQSFDNCFTINFTEGQPICLLQNSEKNIQVEIIANESYPYLQFYIPPHRKSIAIENISGAPDAFNNEMGFKKVQPGETETFSASYKITLLT